MFIDMPLTSYTQSALMPSERIIYAADLHNFRFVFAGIMIFLGILFLIPPDLANTLDATENSAQQEAQSTFDIAMAWVRYYLAWAQYYITTWMQSLPGQARDAVNAIMGFRQNMTGMILLAVGGASFLLGIIKKMSVEHSFHFAVDNCFESFGRRRDFFLARKSR